LEQITFRIKIRATLKLNFQKLSPNLSLQQHFQVLLPQAQSLHDTIQMPVIILAESLSLHTRTKNNYKEACNSRQAQPIPNSI